MTPRFYRPQKPSARLGVMITGTWGGGITIIAKPNQTAAIIMAFARETGRRLDPEVIPWSPRMLPRLRWQLLHRQADALLRWLMLQPPTWATNRLLTAIRHAMLDPRGLDGCEPC